MKAVSVAAFQDDEDPQPGRDVVLLQAKRPEHSQSVISVSA